MWVVIFRNRYWVDIGMWEKAPTNLNKLKLHVTINVVACSLM